MLNVELLRRTLGRASPRRWDWLRRPRRSVRVSVVVDEREVDSFVVADPSLLRAALAPVLRHLPSGRGYLRLSALEESRLPLGLSARRRELRLASTLAAQAYLDAGAAQVA